MTEENQSEPVQPAATTPGAPEPVPAAATPPEPPAPADAPQEPQESPQAARERDEQALRIAELERQLSDTKGSVTKAVADALAQSRGEQRGPASRGVTVDLADLDQAARAGKYADWPQRGGAELPQPWDHRAQGLRGAVRDFENDTTPGTPNTVSPIVINHGKPILTHGSSDPSVHDLGRILGHLGFHNSVSDGANAYGAVDNTIMAAVHQFRDAYGVQEDPSGWGGDTPSGRESAAAHIGPWTWEAILRAGERELAHAIR